MKHMGHMAESLWILCRFAGQDVAIPDDTVDPDDTVEGVIDAYEETWQRTDKVVAATPSLDEGCRESGRGAGESAMGSHAPARGDGPTPPATPTYFANCSTGGRVG